MEAPFPVTGDRSSTGIQLLESPKEPLEFLSRTWTVSAFEVSKALSHHPPPVFTASKSASSSSCTNISILEDANNELEQLSDVPPHQFSLSSSATSQLVLERIMSQSEVSPLTSGRLSHSSGPSNGTDSPPISPSDDYDDVVKFFLSHKTLQPLFTGTRTTTGNGCSTPGGSKTVGRWLKDKKEKKKEEARTQNAQLHASISVAAVAAAIAATAAATAASSASSRKSEQASKTDMAVASAAALVAAQCVEAAEVMGAERDHLTSIISSAVNVRSHDDISTLTAAAATALRGAATLKARALKEVWNITSVLPVDKIMATEMSLKREMKQQNGSHNNKKEVAHEDNFLAMCNQELLAQGRELLKRTRNGDLHWKIVSVYINQTGQVVLKTKSKHVAGTITKKKKNVVLEVYKNMPAWPGRHLVGSKEQRRYFGLRIESRGIVEFECKNSKEYDIWTQGVSRLLVIATHKRNKRVA